MTADSFSQPPSEVLDELEPLSRALLDLSLKRGMSDAEIADILGTDAEAVLENRVALLRSVAERVAPESAEADLPELEAAVAERVYGGVNGAPAAEPQPVPVAVPVPDSEGSGQRAEGGGLKPRAALVAVLVVAVLGALTGVIIAVATGGSEESGSPQIPPPGPSSAPLSGGVRLEPLGAARGTATASIKDGRLRLELRGLPDPRGGEYEVWLYNSVIDARPLATLQGTQGSVDEALPRDANRYRYLEVSLEPPDGNPNHSGQSVLRVPIARLTSG
jgi:hypothetical protein